MTNAISRPPAAHIREHGSVLAAAEKRLLVYLAHRLPRAIHSDHLSALGLGSMAVAAASFAALGWTRWAAVGVVAALIANWFGDSLDGTVARVRGQQRPRFGFYVDHVIDLAGTAMLLAGIAMSGLMQPLFAAVLLCAYLLVSAESYLATHSAGVFRMSFIGFGPTELRLVLIAGVLSVLDSPFISGGPLAGLRLFDVGAAVATGGLAIAFLAAAFRNTAALYAAEPRIKPPIPSVSRVA